jgi:hypothetical protein
MSAFSSTGNALKDETDVMGQQETHAPQQTAPWFDTQINGKPRRGQSAT